MALTLHGTVSDNTVALDRKTATPLIINGDMQIAQRGTSFTSLSSGANQVLDRFAFLVNEGTFTVTQDSDVPTGQGFAKSLKIDCTTADTSISNDGYVQLYQRFEGQNLQMLKKGTSSAEYITVAFWVKSNLTGNFVLEVKDHDNSRLICSLVNISSANTWEKKVVSFAGDTTGALTNDNGLSLQVTMWLAAGSDFTSGTLATSWEAQNNVDRAVGTFNIASSTSNEFYTTGWQMEVGTFDANSIPPFQFEDRGTSLARCKRYYQTIGNGTVAGQRFVATGKVRSSTKCDFGLVLPVDMRSSPTISVSDGTGFEVFHGGSTVTNTTSLSYSNSSPQTVSGLFDVSSGLTAGDAAFIRTDGTAGRELQMDSEL
jgi:hypothetical protein